MLDCNLIKTVHMSWLLTKQPSFSLIDLCLSFFGPENQGLSHDFHSTEGGFSGASGKIAFQQPKWH